MPSIRHLSDIWEHTLDEILNHDNKSEVGINMRSWVKHNKLDDMTSLLVSTFNISYLDPNTIMMMMNLTILLIRKIGYCKQEENI